MTQSDPHPFPGRAHLHLLSLAGSLSGRPLPGLPWYDDVEFTPVAARSLRWHLSLPGGWRGGWLYGMPAGEDTLLIEVATASAHPGWDVDVLRGDRQYLLGQADLLRILRPDLDWVASWVICPDNDLPTAGQVERLVRAARQAGVMHEGYALLVVGMHDDRPMGLLCRWSRGVEVTLIPV